MVSDKVVSCNYGTHVGIILIISFMCLATNCVTNIDQSKRENKK
jgi:hypothetical protein